MQQQEQDLELKLRFMKLLWRQGYYLRRNVAVIEFGESTDPYTDIDVVGIKIDNELNTTLIICDCKSGQSARTRERLFWLNGLMKYFNANSAVFLRSKINPIKYRNLSKTLDITIMSETELINLESCYDVAESEYFGSFDQNQQSMENAFRTLKKYSPQIHNYIKTDYWIDSVPNQITTLIKCCKNLKVISQLNEQVRPFLVLYTLSELSIVLIKLAKETMFIPQDQHQEFINIELQGGKTEYQERKRLVGTFYDFMAREIHEKYKQSYPIKKSEFIESVFSLPYSKYLIDLIDRMCLNPTGFMHIPKILDCMAHNYVLKNKVFDIRKIISNYDSNIDHIKKALTDFMIFSERCELLSSELIQKKDSIITEFT
ncbi:MAG TPA: hypothetical protein VNL34_04915 [Candidatus Nitrosotenuis sp.]|nr:hypothetical protein [Candidatus Nitrosotenuis sp.]